MKKVILIIFVLLMLSVNVYGLDSSVVFDNEKNMYTDANYIFFDYYYTDTRNWYLAFVCGSNEYPVFWDNNLDGLTDSVMVYNSATDSFSTNGYSYRKGNYYLSSDTAYTHLDQYGMNSYSTLPIGITITQNFSSWNYIERNIPTLFASVATESELLTYVRGESLADPNAPSVYNYTIYPGDKVKFSKNNESFNIEAIVQAGNEPNLTISNYQNGRVNEYVMSPLSDFLIGSSGFIELELNSTRSGQPLVIVSSAEMVDLNVDPSQETGYLNHGSLLLNDTLDYASFENLTSTSQMVTVKPIKSPASNESTVLTVEQFVNGFWKVVRQSQRFNHANPLDIKLHPNERLNVFNDGGETVVTYPIVTGFNVVHEAKSIQVAQDEGLIDLPYIPVESSDNFDEYYETATESPDFGTGIDSVFNFFVWVKDLIIGGLTGIFNLIRDIFMYIVMINSYIGDMVKIFADLFGSIPPIIWAIVITSLGMRFFYLFTGRN